MKIRWLSGNQAGVEEDVPLHAAEHAIAFGSAELVPDTPAEPTEEEAKESADTGMRRRRKAE